MTSEARTSSLEKPAQRGSVSRCCSRARRWALCICCSICGPNISRRDRSHLFAQFLDLLAILRAERHAEVFLQFRGRLGKLVLGFAPLGLNLGELQDIFHLHVDQLIAVGVAVVVATESRPFVDFGDRHRQQRVPELFGGEPPQHRAPESSMSRPRRPRRPRRRAGTSWCCRGIRRYCFMSYFESTILPTRNSIQLGIRGHDVVLDVVDRLDQPNAHHALPQPVRNHVCEPRVLRRRHPAGIRCLCGCRPA